MMRKLIPSPWFAAVLAWALVVAFGFGVLWRYAAAPGAAAHAPSHWPEAMSLARARDRATLVMFVHPECPCSRASLADLDNMVRRVPGRVSPLVVVAAPAGAKPGDGDDALSGLAARLPGVTIFQDIGGVEARRFGAATSGATLVYDAAGGLAFEGGITQSRGHEGDSFGEERIVALLEGRTPDRRDSPVFGCPLAGPMKESTP